MLWTGVDAGGQPVSEPAKEFHDPAKLAPLHRGFFLSAGRGADWLYRHNRPDGLFLYGYVPSLDAPLDEDHYLRQIGGAIALARAARFSGDPRYTARARQAILALLASTATDGKDANVRYSRFANSAANRLGAAGLLVLAINELPQPGEDLLEQSDQLCRWIVKQQQQDGALKFGDELAANPLLAPFEEDREGINYYPGEALYGLARSQQYRPATWKTDALRRAFTYYRGWWRDNKNTAFVPWQTSAYVELYLQTREKAFAEFVFEMNDWMCSLQFTDAAKPMWQGGFALWHEGKALNVPPRISSASYAEGLVDACRAAKAAGDVQRHQRYVRSTEMCLQFLTTLQYTGANTRHFHPDFRPRVMGAFHGSHQDGVIRVDFTQHAICALYQYLQHVADIAPAPVSPPPR
jgi:hypothetical protein